MSTASALQENVTIAKTSFTESWERVRVRLKAAYGEATFKSWLGAMHYESAEGRQILITVPTRFMREWISAHYAEEILRFCRMEDSSLISIDIRVRSAPASDGR